MEYLEAKELIIRGRVGEALRLLREPLRGTSLYDEWIVLSSRYGQLEEQEMKGLLSLQDLSIERNRITEATLRLLDRAKADASVPVEDRPRRPAARPRLPWFWLGLAAVLLVLLGIAYALWPTGTPEHSTPALTEPAEARVMPEEKPSSAVTPPPAKPSSPPPTVPATTQASDRGTAEAAPQAPPETITDQAPRQPEPAAPADSPTPSPPALADESGQDRYDRYVVRKRVNNDYLPFEMHYLSVGERHVLLELTVHNQGEREVEIKEVQLLHSADRSSASSYNLEGRQIPAAQKEKLTAKFRWELDKPVAFRLKLLYRLAGERSWREVRNDFGVYHRAD